VYNNLTTQPQWRGIILYFAAEIIHMVSVEEAKQLILLNTKRLAPMELTLSECFGLILAEDVISPISFPPFDQSTMDGFAVSFSDIIAGREIALIGEAPAGAPYMNGMCSGEAVRVFTGSQVPEGADTVIIQENVSVENGKLIIHTAPFKQGDFIQKKSSQIEAGSLALPAGTLLTPPAIGFLAGSGIATVKVIPRPRVSIIITGNELQSAGTALADGQVYESNSLMLSAALQEMGISEVNILYAGDTEEQTKDTIHTALMDADVVLVSGGISVGKYDHVLAAMEKSDVRNIFYKVYQRPGKPLFFGTQGHTLLFALPGNPVSGLVCFYEYVYPALRQMQGFHDVFLRSAWLRLSSGLDNSSPLFLYLRAKAEAGNVTLILRQESNNIGAFAGADCLVCIPPMHGTVKAGDLVEVHLLPWCGYAG
jgi:molybdopterin molybdotransferase